MSNKLIFSILFFVSVTLFAQERKEFLPLDLPREVEDKPKAAELTREETPDWSLLFDLPFGDSTFYGGYYGATYVEPSSTFWVSVGHTNEIYEISPDGTLISTFSIDGVQYITSMTSDGEHVYAVTYNQYILEIDPVSKTLVNTIVPEMLYTAVSVTFDPGADNGNGGFWLNIWHQDLVLVNRQGEILDTIPWSNLSPFSIYGIAFDNYSEGGPYLWVMDIGHSYNTPQNVRQIDINTKMPTGVAYTITEDIAINEYYTIGEDLFITTDLYDGTIVLGGTVTGFPLNHLFGYDIGSSSPQNGPGNATFPQPTAYEADIPIDNQPTISWTNPSTAEYNKVYFSKNLNEVASYSPNALVADGTPSMLYSSYDDHGTLEYSTNYYWRVVEYEGSDSSRGRVWRFTTRTEPAPLTAQNIMAEWDEQNDIVSVNWDNPTLNIYDEPIEVDSAYIYADGDLAGKTFGAESMFVWNNPPSGIFEITIIVYDNDFASETAVGPMVGVDVYYNSFSLNNLNLIIPDDHGVTPLISTLNIPESQAIVEKVIVSVDTVFHTWVGDLHITLRSPNGTEVLLSAGNGGSGDDIFNAVFDDDAELPIHGAHAPMTGQWYPQQPLPSFNNQSASGDWELIFLDDFGMDQGTLQAWTLTLITNFPLPGNEQLDWELPISVNNNLDGNRTISIGESVGATDSIDLYLGERILPPLPPFDLFDVRLQLPTDPAEFSWKDYRSSDITDNLWVIKLQSPAETFPVTISWDTLSIPEDIELYLTDGFTGDIFSFEMRETNSITIDNPAITELHIQKSTISTMSMPVYGGWNLVAMPMMLDNMAPLSVFQNATSQMFGFDDGYYAADMLDVGNGYWVQFEIYHTVGMTGNLITDNHIEVNEGWNLVGVHHYNVNVEDITSEPEGIIATQFFGYDNGYYTAEQLGAAKGYWVKTTSPGIVHLPPASVAKKEETRKELLSEKLVLTDALGKNYTLYLSSEGYAGSRELPPLPPAGAGDVRFSDDTFISDSENNMISIKDLTYPITISLSGNDITLKDAVTGGLFYSTIRDGESVTLSDSRINSLQVSSVEIPASYSLEQNYPNPFNPATTIKFSLPAKENVNISIYNTLGELVDEIVNAEFDAGYHTLNFNASNLSSGVYIYRISAGNFNDVKKMMLLK
ncbi:MAG: hypothetical protein SCALA702_05110 [Melioribacteraceae bacterium]|nr:MAG: hypothetical protein SCALA702_05110 [Melioribacteraceae bacterium]